MSERNSPLVSQIASRPLYRAYWPRKPRGGQGHGHHQETRLTCPGSSRSPRVAAGAAIAHTSWDNRLESVPQVSHRYHWMGQLEDIFETGRNAFCMGKTQSKPTMSTKGKWQWMDDHGWVPYKPSVSNKIEAAFLSDGDPVTFTHGSKSYVIDHDDLIQVYETIIPEQNLAKRAMADA
eukprot:1334274-Amorphochlora_amoeboformis.AAC.1